MHSLNTTRHEIGPVEYTGSPEEINSSNPQQEHAEFIAHMNGIVDSAPALFKEMQGGLEPPSKNQSASTFKPQIRVIPQLMLMLMLIMQSLLNNCKML